MLLSWAKSLIQTLRFQEEILIDTDIGDDIDDAFAIAWALASPRIKVSAVLTAHGDTLLRTRLVARMLQSRNREDVQVFAGVKTKTDIVFTQRLWAENGPSVAESDGIAAALDLIRSRKHRITLVTLAPLHNIKAMIERDPATFRMLKRVVVMGGSIRRGYNSLDGEINPTPQGEHNIFLNPPALHALLNIAVPITMMPLDAVQARPSGGFLSLICNEHPDLAELLALWQENNIFDIKQPTLFDVVAIAAVLAPKSCPLTTLRIAVDDSGMTTEVSAGAEVQACLKTDHEKVLDVVARELCPSKSFNTRLSSSKH